MPAANRLGEEGEGFKIAMKTLDFTRPGTAIGAVGVARAAYELAVDYSRERVQFGQPIAMNQGVNFLIADMAAEIEAARLLTWQAAWLLDQGIRSTLQSSFAKRFASDTAMKVTTDAVQIFGGYGYMKEYPVEKLMRDAKLFQIYEGTSQIQRLVIAQRDLLPARLKRPPIPLHWRTCRCGPLIFRAPGGVGLPGFGFSGSGACSSSVSSCSPATVARARLRGLARSACLPARRSPASTSPG